MQGMRCHTEKMVVLVDFLEELEKVLEIVDSGVALLDGSVQNGC